MKRKNKTTLSHSDALRLRVMQAKAKLPNGGKGYHYGTIIEYEFGKMTEQEKTLLHNVWNIRDSNEEMTIKIEQLVEIVIK